MTRILVIPPDALDRVEPLLQAGGWKAAAGPEGARDVDAALEIVRQGDPVLVVPQSRASAASSGGGAARITKVVVVHEGNRGDRAGMDAADDCAVASGAEIVVLHVPATAPGPPSGSLAFRIADHGEYDLAEWREEFLRRFCRCSPGVRVTLRVGAGSPDQLREDVRAEGAELAIVSGPPIEGQGDGEILDAVLGGNVPLLIVPSVGRDRSTQAEAERGQHRRLRPRRPAPARPRKVRDLMTKEVVSVDPSMPLRQVARTLIERRVSGVPVVDADGTVVGVVTEADVVTGGRAAAARGRSRRTAWLLEDAMAPPRPRQHGHDLDTTTAGQAMTAPAITTRPDEPLEEAARLMSQRHVNRLPVVEEGRLVGIVARVDIVRTYLRAQGSTELEAGDPPGRGEPDDEGVQLPARDHAAPTSRR